MCFFVFSKTSSTVASATTCSFTSDINKEEEREEGDDDKRVFTGTTHAKPRKRKTTEGGIHPRES